MPGIFFLASFPAWPASTCSPCLHLSVPPGDSGSPPPWRTTQPAPFSASSPLEARALSHPAPRPRRLCVLGQPPLSSLRSPLPRSGRRSISLGLPPTTAPPPPPPAASPAPSPSICLPQALFVSTHLSPPALGPLPRATPARPLSPWLSSLAGLRAPSLLQPNKDCLLPLALPSFFLFPDILSALLFLLSLVSLASPQLMGEGGDSGVPAPSP